MQEPDGCCAGRKLLQTSEMVEGRRWQRGTRTTLQNNLGEEIRLIKYGARKVKCHKQCAVLPSKEPFFRSCREEGSKGGGLRLRFRGEKRQQERRRKCGQQRGLGPRTNLMTLSFQAEQRAEMPGQGARWTSGWPSLAWAKEELHSVLAANQRPLAQCKKLGDGNQRSGLAGGEGWRPPLTHLWRAGSGKGAQSSKGERSHWRFFHFSPSPCLLQAVSIRADRASSPTQTLDALTGFPTLATLQITTGFDAPQEAHIGSCGHTYS